MCPAASNTLSWMQEESLETTVLALSYCLRRSVDSIDCGRGWLTAIFSFPEGAMKEGEEEGWC